MAIAIIVALGILGAVVPVVFFAAAKAKPVDLTLAAIGFGGLVATIASMGPFYREGPYLFVPLAALCTAALMLATARVVHYRGPVRWRWARKPSAVRKTPGATG
jgi:hypothetical protein